MTPTSLIIVTDRGSLKAYKVDETPTRGASLRLIQAFDTTDAHGRFGDKVTDQAGAFPHGNAGGGPHQNSIAERKGIETENDRRIFRQLADNIADVVKRDAPMGWSLAAPAPIHSAVVDLLPDDVRARLVEHVKSDLVKTEPAELAGHFRSLQPV
jgi:hypothetical protein